MNTKQKEETTTRLSPIEREAKFSESRKAAVEKALQGEKVRYKSNCDPIKFKEFLEHRLTIWDELKDKTFHSKRMYEKTVKILDNFE
jgi:phage-related protein